MGSILPKNARNPNILYKIHYTCHVEKTLSLNSFKNVQERGSRKESSCFLVLILAGHGWEQSCI